MKLKTKIWIIGLGVIALVVIGVGIYWIAGKKSTFTAVKETTLKEHKVSTQLPEKLEPKLVWEKKFDSEIVDFKVWTIPKITLSNIIPIMSVQTKKHLFLLNEKGKVVRKLPLGKLEFLPRYRIIVSENGKYVMEVESKYLGDDVTEEGETLLGHGLDTLETYRYTTWEGNVLWERKDIYESECYQVYTYITPNGDRIIVVGDDGSISNPHRGVWFYNKKGKIIKGYSYKEIKYSKDGLLDGKEVKCNISGDGNLFVLGYPDYSKKCIEVILFDKDGNILWKRSIPMQGYGDVVEVNISYHGEIICADADTFNHIYIYNEKGELICRLEKRYRGEYLQRFFTSPKGDFLVAIFPSFITLIDIPTGKEVKRINLKDKWLYEFAISPDNHLIAITERNKLYIISQRGDVISEIVFNEDILGNECIFSNDSKSLFISYIKDDNKTIGLYKIEVGDLK